MHWPFVLCFLCSFSITLAVNCPSKSFPWHNYCYFFQTNATNIFNAELACNALGGHLVSIHDGFTNGVIASQAAKEFDATSVSDFWIGLNTLTVPEKWTWTDSTTYDFPEWGSNIPTDIVRKCAAFTLHNGYWIADDCFKIKPFVCEALLTDLNPTSAPSATNCSDGYTFFEPTRSCYGADHSYYATWAMAEKNCVNQGGHLASFHTREEVEFMFSLNSLTAVPLWTGLYYINNTWQFSDGSQLGYLPWASNYPQSPSAASAYISLDLIYNDNSNTSYFSICKKAAI
uniref:C-type lectin domain-containing protein n=1 Tax=Panagrolaimus sp. PS1159 TaxID=55785 RepID=A0AC35FP69_9BILA